MVNTNLDIQQRQNSIPNVAGFVPVTQQAVFPAFPEVISGRNARWNAVPTLKLHTFNYSFARIKKKIAMA